MRILTALAAVDKEYCFLEAWWHHDVYLFEVFYGDHVSHKIAEFTPGLRLLKTYFAEPFAQE